MKVTATTVTKLVISEVVHLDPITVILEDIRPGQGKIIIECYGESWSAGWGDMGDRSLSDFIQSSDDDYLITNLVRGIDRGRPDYGLALMKKARAHVRQRRRMGDLSPDYFRDLLDRCDSLYEESHKDLCAIFGDDWWNEIPTKPNPQYEYMRRIVTAVRDALPQAAGVDA
jgi:hypothetical protein